MPDQQPLSTTEKTWTFCGHWENDRIVIDEILDGAVEDDRDQDDDDWDGEYYEEGLWAASGTGTDVDAVMTAVIAEYEREYNNADANGVPYPEEAG